MMLTSCWLAQGCARQSSGDHGSSGGGSGGTLSAGGTGAESSSRSSSGGSNSGGASAGSRSSAVSTSDRGGSSGSGGRGSGGADQGGTGGGGGLSQEGGSSTGGRAGATTDTGGQGTSGNGPTAVTGLKIDDNPKNVLAAFVSWTTDKPGDSVVQFDQGKYEWEISDPTLVTSHKVLIIGMNANKTYQVKAMSSAGGTPVSATGSYTTKALPAQIPVAKVPINETDKVQPGWTLMNIIKSGSSAGPISNDPSAAVIFDSSGQPVWYHINGTAKDFGGAISTYLTDKGVLIGPAMGSNGPGESPREVDFAGNTIWECKDPKCGGTGDLTHDTIKLSNGNHVVLRWQSQSSGFNGDSSPIFEEIDANDKVVWSLDFGALVPKPSNASGDWCHGNSISIDLAKDEVYANCRFMGLLKTSYKNPKSLLWYLPASYGKATGNMTFSPTTSQYSDTHDPEVHDDGTILVFDNGGYSASMMPGGSTTKYHSRAVEYKIDEAKKAATLVWEFPGTFSVDSWYKDSWYNSYFGDADRLANGNVLIAAGSIGSKAGDARVFEVTKSDGKVVWEFRLDAGFGCYRADRIVPPLVKAIK